MRFLFIYFDLLPVNSHLTINPTQYYVRLTRIHGTSLFRGTCSLHWARVYGTASLSSLHVQLNVLFILIFKTVEPMELINHSYRN